ncbi:MAG: glycosyltransferase, partial [Acidimicrobiales bacterium]
SWCVWGVDETFDAVLAAGGYVPVLVCGRDEALRDHLQARAQTAGSRAVVIGWTDAMHELMAACDCLVENAGGLTAMEALYAGLPVITFRPIAGHGKENAAAMSYAGVTTLARDPAALVAALREVTQPGERRQAQIDAGHAMFVADAADVVLRASAGEDLILVRPRRRSLVVAARLALGSLVISGLAWTGMTFGVGVAAAAGIGVTHPPNDAGRVLYLGVRLDQAELDDPAVTATVLQLGATAIVDRETALASPGTVAAIALEGVDVENGGQGEWLNSRGRPNAPSPWDRASADVAAADTLEALVGHAVDVYAPGRSLNAFDLVDAAQANDMVVVPNFTLFAAHPPKDSARLPLAPRQVDFVSGRNATPDQLEAQLLRMRVAISADKLSVVPLSAMR